MGRAARANPTAVLAKEGKLPPKDPPLSTADVRNEAFRRLYDHMVGLHGREIANMMYGEYYHSSSKSKGVI